MSFLPELGFFNVSILQTLSFLTNQVSIASEPKILLKDSGGIFHFKSKTVQSLTNLQHSFSFDFLIIQRLKEQQNTPPGGGN